MSDAPSPAYFSTQAIPLLPSATRQHRSQSDFDGRSVDVVTPSTFDYSYFSTPKGQNTSSGLVLKLAERKTSDRLLVGSHASLEPSPSIMSSLFGMEESEVPNSVSIFFPDKNDALPILCKLFNEHKPISIPQEFQTSSELKRHYISLLQVSRLANKILPNIPSNDKNNDIILFLRNIEELASSIGDLDNELAIPSQLNTLKNTLYTLLAANPKAIEDATKVLNEDLKTAQSYIHTYVHLNGQSGKLYSALIDAIVAAQSYSLPTQSYNSQFTTSAPIPIPFTNTCATRSEAKAVIIRLSDVLRDYRVFLKAYPDGAQILTALFQQAEISANGCLIALTAENNFNNQVGIHKY